MIPKSNLRQRFQIYSDQNRREINSDRSIITQ